VTLAIKATPVSVYHTNLIYSLAWHADTNQRAKRSIYNTISSATDDTAGVTADRLTLNPALNMTCYPPYVSVEGYIGGCFLYMSG